MIRPSRHPIPLCLLASALLAGAAAAQPAEQPGQPAAEPPAAEPAAQPAEAPAQPPEQPATQPPEQPAEPPTAEPVAPSADEPGAKAAEAPAPDEEAPAPASDQPPLAPGQERPLPDYDGRGDEPLTAGDVFIWVPRSIFFPVYLVTEYGLRWPLGQITSAVDEHDVAGILTDFFTFGPGGNSGLVPSGLIDFGFRPSIGLYFFSDDVLVEDLGFRSHLAFGGVDWYRATGTVRYHFSHDSAQDHERLIQLKGIYSHRPDWKFYGLGPSSVDAEQSRYTAQYVDGTVRYQGGYWRSGRIGAWAGVRDAQFQPHGCCSDVAISAAVLRDYYPLPPLFDDGYLIGRVGTDLSLDTRERRFAFEGDATDHESPSGTGIKLAGRAEVAGGLRESPAAAASDETTRLGWIKYGGTLGGYLDLYEQRVLGAQLMVDFADPFAADGEIPFTELVSLGGARPMRGFLEQRLLGRSSAVAQLEYRWPIWVSLDGAAHYAVGNVFDEHLEGLEGDKLRQSFGLGFRANGSRDHAFEFLLAFGTETFEQGSEIDTVRLVLGASEGF